VQLGRALTIHIIEDDPGVRDALGHFLEVLGHAVRPHPDGESFVAAEPPRSNDLVFVDLALPGMGGQQVIDWIRDLPEPPRVVAISGQAKAAVQGVRQAFSAVPLLRKPLAPEAVLALL
jgi:CheY-like chemotaxis protein